MDITGFMDTKAAYVHNLDDGKQTDPREVSGPFVWPSGYQKLAAGTMATLFWAGDIFAWQHCMPVDEETRKALANVQLDSSSSTTSIQTLLQASYLYAFGRLSDALVDCPALLGFEVQNEPHRGFIELHSWDSWKYETDLHIGHYPSLLQALALGEGHAQKVPYYVKTWPWPTRRSHWSLVDPKGTSCWSKGGDSRGCIWARHGAWQWDAAQQRPVVLRRDYFTHDPRPRDVAPDTSGQKVEWYRDCYVPLVKRFTERMRRMHHHPDTVQIWFEPIPNEYHPPWPSSSLSLSADEDASARSNLAAISRASTGQRYSSATDLTSRSLVRPTNVVFSPHFYDLNVLFGKVFNGWFSVDVQALSRGTVLPKALWLGVGGLKRNYLGQLSNVASYARSSLGEVPVVIGEVGIPFDINGGVPSGEGGSPWHLHEDLLDALAAAMEGAKGGIAGWAWWNYNPDNVPQEGDYWNREDFSFVSSSGQEGGATEARRNRRQAAKGRALGAIVRPYAVRLAGVPVRSRWDRHSGVFELEYVNWAKPPVSAVALTGATSQDESEATVIYVPQLHLGNRDGPHVITSDGSVSWDGEAQRLLWWVADRTPGAKHSLRITIGDEKPQQQSRMSLSRLDLSGTDVLAVLAVLVAAVALFVGAGSVVGRLQAQATAQA